LLLLISLEYLKFFIIRFVHKIYKYNPHHIILLHLAEKVGSVSNDRADCCDEGLMLALGYQQRSAQTCCDNTVVNTSCISQQKLHPPKPNVSCFIFFDLCILY